MNGTASKIIRKEDLHRLVRNQRIVIQGFAREKDRNHDKAFRLIRTYKESISAEKNMLMHLINAADKEDRNEFITAFKRLQQKNMIAALMTSDLFVRKGQYRQSIDLLSHELENQPYQLGLIAARAGVYEKMGLFPNAAAEYRKLLFFETDPKRCREIRLSMYRSDYPGKDEAFYSRILAQRENVRRYIRRRLQGDTVEEIPDTHKVEGDEEASPRILFGSMEIANHMATYTKLLRAQKFCVFSVNYQPNYLKYKNDFELHLRLLDHMGVDLRQFLERLACELIAEFDTFHFLFNNTLLPGLEDLKIIRELGKTAVMHNVGSDVRQPDQAISMNPYMRNLEHTYLKKLEKSGNKAKMRELAKWIDTVIVADSELAAYVAPFYRSVEYVRIPIDLEKTVTVEEEYVPGKQPLTIVHAPTSPEVKGSGYIQDAVEKLKKKFDFEYVQVQNLAHNEALKVYRRADIIVDQLLLGAYGGFAVECMAMGKPVVCWISEHLKNFYPDDLPIVIANPDTIESVLEELIRDRSKLIGLGKRCRRYVEKYHDARHVVHRFLDIYRRASRCRKTNVCESNCQLL